MIHKTKEQEQQEVEQLFADFAAGSWQPSRESAPPEVLKQKPPVPKKRFHKKLLIAILAAAVCLGLVTAYLLRPLPMQIVTLSSGANHIKAVCKDGTVLSTVSGEWSGGVIPIVQDTAHWTDIVSISVGDLHTLGLKKDGTVVSTEINYLTDAIPAAVSSTTYDYMQHGQTETSSWTDIVAVAAGLYHSVGLRKDGTVVAVGDNSSGQCEVSEWRNIVAIEASDYCTIGLRKDGTVVTTRYIEDYNIGIDTWTDIVAISAGAYHVLGLRDDGTVVAAGSNIYGRCNVATWTDITSISAGPNHSVGIRKDGTIIVTQIPEVIAVSYVADYGQTNVDDWQDIVAIDTTQFHIVGLTADGKVVLAGLNSAPYTAVKQWENIQVP